MRQEEWVRRCVRINKNNACVRSELAVHCQPTNTVGSVEKFTYFMQLPRIFVN